MTKIVLNSILLGFIYTFVLSLETVNTDIYFHSLLFVWNWSWRNAESGDDGGITVFAVSEGSSKVEGGGNGT